MVPSVLPRRFASSLPLTVSLGAVLTLVACTSKEPAQTEATSRQAIEFGGSLPPNAVQRVGLTWYADDSAPRAAGTMLNACSRGAFLNQSGWRSPTSAEMTEFAAGRMSVPNWGFFDTIVSSTPSGAGFMGVQGPSANSFVASPNTTYPRTICVSQPQNMVSSGNLTWYRETQTARQAGSMSSFCASLNLMGRTGWRLPTQLEAQALYGNRGNLPNLAYWLSTSADPSTIVVTSTTYQSGTFVIALKNGATVVLGPTLTTNATCVTGDGFGSSGADGQGLVWYRDPQGQPDVLGVCRNASYLGHGGWRAPSKEEAQAFVASRPSVPNYDAWLAMAAPDMLLTATPDGTTFEAENTIVNSANGAPTVNPSGFLCGNNCQLQGQFFFPSPGSYRVAVRAKADNDLWGGPTVAIDVDGAPADATLTFNDETRYVELATNVAVPSAGMKTVTVAFVNDAWNPATSDDRNIYFDRFVVGSQNGFVAVARLSDANQLIVGPASGPVTCVSDVSLGGLPTGWVTSGACAVNNGGCSADATCTATQTGVSCSCKTGYTGDGFTCADINECASNNGGCNTNATCSNLPGSRNCTCNAGYTGTGSDGIVCHENNECLTNNGGCSANALCGKIPGGHVCTCKVGYGGDGVSCNPVAACTATANLPRLGWNFETPSSSSGVYEPAGMVKGGVSRAASISSTSWVTPPEGLQLGFLYASGTLTVVFDGPAGTYSLSALAMRWMGAGGTIQPVAVTVDGASVGSMNPTSTTTFTRFVLPNFTVGSGAHTIVFAQPANSATFLIDALVATLVTPVTVVATGCGSNATCSSQLACVCNAGYSGNGLSCTDVDECQTGNGGCAANTACTNTPGSRTCACKGGFIGDGVTCSCPAGSTLLGGTCVSTIAHAGKTDTSASVGTGGSFQYDLPLRLPPSVAGNSFPLAMHYESSAKGGLLGVGWTLSGFSVIARCPKTYAGDGRPAPVAFSQQDRLCLDGQPLKLVSGSYGAAGSKYATEQESFALVEAVGQSGNGPTSFQVTSRVGGVQLYGGLVSDGSTFLTWGLTEQRDAVGNATRVTWTIDSNAARVTRIDFPYTASGQGPYSSVEFNYVLRSSADTSVGYNAGLAVQLRYLLDRVTTRNLATSAVIRTYSLTYGTGASSNRSLLTGVQECAGGKCLPATTFQYEPGSAGFDATPIVGSDLTLAPSANTSGCGFVTGDFNADGRADLIYGQYDVSPYSYKCLWSLRASTGTGYAADVPLNAFKTKAWDEPVETKYRPLTGNLLGNGRVQLMLAVPEQTNMTSPVYTVIDFTGPGTFTSTSTGLAAPDAMGLPEAVALLADMNGDGLSDLVTIENGNKINVRLNTTVPGGAVGFSATKTTVALAPSGHLFRLVSNSAGDLNRDGLADLMMNTMSSSGTMQNILFYTNPGSVSGVPQALTLRSTVSYAWPTAGPENAGMQKRPILLDWNGDDCTDYFSGANLFLSKCDGTFAPTSVTLPVELWDRNVPTPIDFDGDGRDDIVFVRLNATGRALADGFLNVIRSIGGGAAASPVAITVPVEPGFHFPGDADGNGETGYSALNLLPMDVDGDGQLDLGTITQNVASGTMGGFPVVYRRRGGGMNGAPVDAMTLATDGFGQTHAVSYAPATNAAVYTKGTGAIFPVADVTPGARWVSKVTSTDGIGGLFDTVYTYSGARVHQQGRGFLGVATRTSTDGRSGLKTTETYQQNFPMAGMLTSRTVSRPVAGNPDRPLEIVQASPGVQTFGSGFEARYFTFNQSETTSTYETNLSTQYPMKDGVLVRTTSTTSVYGDGFGNPTQVTTVVNDVDATSPASPTAGQSWSTVTTTSYDNNTGTPRCLGLPNATTVTSTAPGMPSLTRTTTMVNNLVACRVSSVTSEPGDNRLRTVSTSGYDACGNLTSRAVQGSSADGTSLATRISTTSFGARCQFAESTTNAAGEGTSSTYDVNFGVPLTTTDSSGLTTSWQYDALGRVTREGRPDGTWTEFRRDAAVALHPEAAIKLVVGARSYSSSGLVIDDSDEAYDALNRVRYTDRVDVTGQWIQTSATSYDALGRIAEERLPQAVGGATLGIRRWTYDFLNRPVTKSLVRPDATVDRVVTYTYLGTLRVELGTRGYGTILTYDPMGRLRRVWEPVSAGTTTYEYDSLGNLSRIQDAIGAVSSFVSDVRGNRLSESLPDRGTTTFAVNSLGEIERQVDAKNTTVVSTFDALGRLRTRSEPEGTSTWTYGTTASARDVGRVTSISGPGYSESRTFDSVGRLSRRVVTTDAAYSFDYGYEAGGRLETLQYPSSFGARFTLQYRYSGGQVVGLLDATSTARQLWRLDSANPSSLPTQETYGSGTPVPLTVLRTYKSWTNELTQLQAGTVGLTSNLLNLSATWDLGRNLATRTDGLRSLTEAFTSDALNRLTTSTLNGAANLDVAYDASGRVTYKSDVGNYVYNDTAHPHAVTGAGARSFTYDANGNLTSKSGSTQSWYSYDLPSVLRTGSLSSSLLYSPDRVLIRQTDVTSGGTETTHFLGEGLERWVSGSNELWRFELPTPGAGKVLVERSSSGVKTSSMLTDFLGSPVVVLVNDTGASLDLKFSAFGQRKLAWNWTGTPTATDLVTIGGSTRTGFTGHRQLDTTGFVHMKGRVYDPEIGRFLSVDPLATLERPQSLNAYSYVNNRPHGLSDPSGFAPRDEVDVPWSKPADQIEKSTPKQVDVDARVEINGLRNRSNRDTFQELGMGSSGWERTIRKSGIDDVVRAANDALCSRNPVERMSRPVMSASPSTPATNKAPSPFNVMGRLRIRVTANFFFGRPGKFGLAGGGGAIMSKDGLGAGGSVLGVTPMFNAGWSYATAGAKPDQLVSFATANPPYVSWTTDDAFIGSNVGVNVPGIGGVNIGEEGIAVWKGGLIKVGEYGNLGVGIAISHPGFGEAFRNSTYNNPGCSYCFTQP